MWRDASIEKPNYPEEVLCYVETKNFYTGEVYHYYMIGYYIPKLTVSAFGEWTEFDCDYDEESDCYYYPEGWVEVIYNIEDCDFAYVEPSDIVLYWKPTTKLGAAETKKEN